MSLANSSNTGIGQPVRRREDFRLLTGRGCYSDDFNFPGQAHAVMVRSPHAHARIRSIDKRAAAAAPTFMYIGSFTQKDGGHGEGLSVYRRESEAGPWMLVDVMKQFADP